MKLLTTTEVAARLGVTPIRVRAMCQNGDLPAEKVGRDWLIKESALNKFTPRRRGRPRKEGQ